jgi:hypothetical protein
MKRFFSIIHFLALALLILAPTARADDVPPKPTTPAPQGAVKPLKVTDGTISFLMDAPIERIKGDGKIVGGDIYFDGKDFKSIKGTVLVDVSTFRTFTFDDAEKNAAQTEHMHNWMEVGNAVDAAKREQLKTATLTFDGAQSATLSPKGSTILKLDANLTLHGITKKVPLTLAVTQHGSGYTVTTDTPFLITLADHDIKPRDLAGQILQKGLEALGQKVAKDAQVSVSAELQPAP